MKPPKLSWYDRHKIKLFYKDGLSISELVIMYEPENIPYWYIESLVQGIKRKQPLYN
jgi:hypothetical protein